MAMLAQPQATSTPLAFPHAHIQLFGSHPARLAAWRATAQVQQAVPHSRGARSAFRSQALAQLSTLASCAFKGAFCTGGSGSAAAASQRRAAGCSQFYLQHPALHGAQRRFTRCNNRRRLYHWRQEKASRCSSDRCSTAVAPAAAAGDAATPSDACTSAAAAAAPDLQQHQFGDAEAIVTADASAAAACGRSSVAANMEGHRWYRQCSACGRVAAAAAPPPQQGASPQPAEQRPPGTQGAVDSGASAAVNSGWAVPAGGAPHAHINEHHVICSCQVDLMDEIGRGTQGKVMSARSSAQACRDWSGARSSSPASLCARPFVADLAALRLAPAGVPRLVGAH